MAQKPVRIHGAEGAEGAEDAEGTEISESQFWLQCRRYIRISGAGGTKGASFSKLNFLMGVGNLHAGLVALY